MVRSIESLTVGPDTSLEEAMQTIDRNGLGVVFVVSDGGTLVGIATDGDIRRGIIAGDSLETSITEVMTEDPVVASADWSDAEFKEWAHSPEVKSTLPKTGALTVPVVTETNEIVDVIYVNQQNQVVRSRTNSDESVKTVLVIGGAGYIGSVLSSALLEEGYEVRVLDLLMYGSQGVDDLVDNDAFTLIEGDMRSIETIVDAIKGVDAVIHLGALVGDPASAINPQKTLEMNYHSTKMIAEICKYHQINRFIFASTCSVYGQSVSEETLLTEQSPLNPVSLYAQSKIESERALLQMEDNSFSPTIFRMATIYGLSPRMRFDLVVNILSAKAYDEGVIPIFGGEQYRPLVHVRDASQAYIDCLETPISDVTGKVFNVGSDEQNYKIKEVGEMISDVFPEAKIDRQAEKEDERSYQVSFSKIRDVLGYETSYSITDGAREIKQALSDGQFNDYTADQFSNYRTLAESPLVDAN